MNIPEKSRITILSEEYKKLKEDSIMLQALEHAGVDNWEGYDIAQDIFEELQENEKEKNK